ncbi:MAG: FAD:protein FMN transferase [Solirubrobacteraceae bacterium]|nr:FAD:protein FMN transferase [Solirubrobacteraceae bacterium]
MLRTDLARAVAVEPVMGTIATIDVRGTDTLPAVVEDVLVWLHEVDARFSTYREDSEIRRLERGALRLADAHPDVRHVLDRCLDLHRETGGAFHVRATGTLDPSAYVKGWAVQCGADMLEAAGCTDFSIACGGDVVVRGGALPLDRWRVGIQHPDDRTAVAATVESRGLAIATSGLYERGAHILDAETGDAPAGVRSVTVTGPDLGTADAYSTAAFAMGVDGPDWTCSLTGYEAMTILADDAVLRTPGFPLTETPA